MRLIALAAVLGAFAFACSSSSGEGAPNEAGWTVAAPGASGSRLRAKVLSGGGAREIVAFFDTARNEECTFQEVTGGRFFCLPNAISSAIGGGFADPSCTQPIITPQTCIADMKYLAVISNGACGSSISSLRTIVGPATTFYSQGGIGGSCVQVSSTSAPQGTSVLAVGETISFDKFVEAQITTETKDGITQRIAVASDGARQPLGYRNEALGADCTFQVMSDGVTRCVPSAGTAQIVYADQECTKATGVLSTNSGSCQAGSVVRDVDPNSGCSRSFYEVGPGTASFDVEEGYVGSTSSGSGTSCSTLFRNASATPIKDVTGTFAKISRVGTGSGRLVPALVSGSAADALVPGWHDTERDVDCLFAKASDGKIRCLPSGASSLIFWTDTACKASTRLAAPTGQRGCVPGGSRFARESSNACTATTLASRSLESATRVFALSGDPQRVGPSSVETSPGRCVTVAGIVGAVPATEVNPADFVEATVATE